MTHFLKRLVNAKTIKRFNADRRGNVGMMFAALLFVMIGGLAIAVDLSSAYSARERLQDTTDAIALLAARDGIEDPVELEAAVQAYLIQAFPNAAGDNIQVVNISRTGDRVDIETTNSINTVFAPIFGQNKLGVSAKSSSVFAQQSLDVALVLDTTGSMRGNKLASLKVSATRLMDTFEALDNDELRVSIVPFGQYVNVGTNQRNQPWVEVERGNRTNRLCMGSRQQPFNTQVEFGREPIPAITDASCGAAVQPLTNDFRALKRTINGLVARGATYAPSGVLWGWRTLDARAPFQEAASNTRGQKVLVLMTDGANTRSVDGAQHTGRNRAAADNLTRDLCERVKGSDITVYTIAYEVRDNNTRNLLRNCASTANNFFNAQNANDLDEAFTNISSTLNELRITS